MILLCFLCRLEGHSGARIFLVFKKVLSVRVDLLMIGHRLNGLYIFGDLSINMAGLVVLAERLTEK